MPVLEARRCIDATPDEVYAWCARPKAFDRLTPPWAKIRVLQRPARLENGAELVFELKRGPLWIRWAARLEDCEPPFRFRDVQVAGPFASWTHTHAFEPAAGGTDVVDRVEYAPPFGVLGLAGRPFIERSLARMFRFRHAQMANDILRQRAFAGAPPLRVAISGAGGLVGGALSAFLDGAGCDVLALVRRPARRDAGEVHYDPATGVVDAAALEGLDALVHLGGVNIGAGRWTAARRAAIHDSRVASTRLLAETLARLAQPPKVFLSASAIGYYGDRGDAPVTEASEPGRGFLADVCREWEAAAAPAERRGIRTVQLRTGVVLTTRGGALARMLAPFRMGLGGRVGSGRQIMSWVALDDVVGAIHFCLRRDDLRGPVNLTAPDAVPNAEFARTLGRVLGRPAIAPLPAMVVRAVFGEMGRELLLEGARVIPAKLQAAGFRFLFPDLAPALAFELGVAPPAH